MSSFSDLLICALRRAGTPLTAADVLDRANALAMDAGWPRRLWTSISVQQVAGLLKALEREGIVCKRGTAKDQGNDRPLWVPDALYDVDAPVPDWGAPTPAPKVHKLEKLSKEQAFVMFDLMEEMVEVLARQRRDLEDLLRKQMDEFSNVMSRAKRELAMHGMDGGAF